MSELTDLIEEVVTKPKNARKIANASRINQRLGELAAGVPVDDGLSFPAAPTGAWMWSPNRTLEIAWDPPDPQDYVASTTVWVGEGTTTFPINKDTNPGGTFNSVQEVTGNTFVTGGVTPGTVYHVYVQHKNIWGRVGDWADAGFDTASGASLDSVEDQINLTLVDILGSLGYANIEDLTAALAALHIDDGALGGTKLTANTITAGQMAAGDAAFINAWIGTAAISSAKIASLTADKISAGNITVSVGITTGSLSAQSVTLDASGVSFNDHTKLRGAFPATVNGDWITPGTGANLPSPYAGMSFFDDATNNVRGIVVRASGAVSGTKNGEVILSADYGNQQPNDNSTAKIRMTSSHSLKGQIELQSDVEALDDLTVLGEVFAAFNTVELTKGANWTVPTISGIRSYIQARRLDGFVMLSGVVQSSAANGNGDDLNLDALPASYIPTRSKFVVAAATSGGAASWDQNRRLVINTSGKIKLAINPSANNNLASGEQISLDGVCYALN